MLSDYHREQLLLCSTQNEAERRLRSVAPRSVVRQIWKELHDLETRPHKANRAAPSSEQAELPGVAPAAPDEAPKPVAGGSIASPDQQRRRLAGTRFVFTSAQNNTHVHTDFWNALNTFASRNNADLYVSRFSYNKSGWGQPTVEDEDIWYDPAIQSYVLDEQVKVANDLVFCGELDILPTAATPLQTLQNYTGPNSGIVPHAKVHMQSQATMKHDPAKFMYTTGTCTMRNYIERKAGQVATFHHTFGALYVEVAEDGTWFARQLIASDNGVFFHLGTAYGPGWSAPAADFGDTGVTLGDIHIEQIDMDALSSALAILNELQPKYVTIHDLIDFQPRNHHNIKDPYFRVWEHWNGIDKVEQVFVRAARFLAGLQTKFPGTTFYVIRSNHDQAFERWLKDVSAATDAANARYWHEANAIKLLGLEQGQDKDIFVWAMQDAADKRNFDLSRIVWVKEDQSLVINDIEHGMHGHRGPNGARGNPKAFRQMGRKANTGHTHSAGIIDGVWTAGVMAKLDMGYNTGPSSWSHSHIVTHPNGKRSILTTRGKEWKA